MGGWPDRLSGADMEALRQNIDAQLQFFEHTGPKGPLWFWEHIPNPYLELGMRAWY